MQWTEKKPEYNITRKLTGRKTNTSKPLKDKDNNVITNLDRPLLNEEDISDAPDLPPGEDLDVDTGPISKDEIIKALRIRTGKAQE